MPGLRKKPTTRRAAPSAAGGAAPVWFGGASRTPWLRPWLLVLLAFAAAWLGRPGLQQAAVGRRRAAASPPEVRLTRPTGAATASDRQFFAANGIQYVEYDIEKSSDALRGTPQAGRQRRAADRRWRRGGHGLNEVALRRLQPWLRGSTQLRGLRIGELPRQVPWPLIQFRFACASRASRGPWGSAHRVPRPARNPASWRERGA